MSGAAGAKGAAVVAAALVAVFLREQVETGDAVFAPNTVHEFPEAEATRLVEAGVAILASELPAPPSSAAEALEALTATHEATVAELAAAKATVTAHEATIVALQADVAELKKKAKP